MLHPRTAAIQQSPDCDHPVLRLVFSDCSQVFFMPQSSFPFLYFCFMSLLNKSEVVFFFVSVPPIVPPRLLLMVTT